MTNSLIESLLKAMFRDIDAVVRGQRLQLPVEDSPPVYLALAVTFEKTVNVAARPVASCQRPIERRVLKPGRPSTPPTSCPSASSPCCIMVISVR